MELTVQQMEAARKLAIGAPVETVRCLNPDHTSDIDEYGCCDACGKWANEEI